MTPIGFLRVVTLLPWIVLPAVATTVSHNWDSGTGTPLTVTRDLTIDASSLETCCRPVGGQALFNLVEAALWFVIALVLLLRLRPPQRLASTFWRWLLPLSFAVFGVSDLIESETGAWWRPWWLLGMKAICVLGFLLAWRANYRK